MSRKKTAEEFIKDAIKIHGYKYDYSLVEYVSNRIKVKIKCTEHSIFDQTPESHLRGSGCPKCGRIKANKSSSLTKNEFIEKSKLKHGNKYDYSLVCYKSSHTKVKIICPIHDIFEQYAGNHMSGQGCLYCGNSRKSQDKKNLSKENFIEKSRLKHGNKYNYDKVVYVRSDLKVVINCPIHGDFLQKPNSHICGKGCNKCGYITSSFKNGYKSSGWSLNSWVKTAEKSKNFNSFKVYIIRCWNETEIFYKIGRTFQKTKNRFKIFPYNYEILQELIFDNAIDCFNKENELKRLHKDFKYIPKITFSGRQECFSSLNYKPTDNLP